MNTTDELREYANTFPLKISFDLIEIAGRIDAEYDEAMSRDGQLLADVEKERDYNYANWQDCKQKLLQGNVTISELNARIERLEDELARRIKPPEDADDEYICIGDVLTDDAEFKSEGKVTRLMLEDGGWMVGFGCGGWSEPSTHEWHHYHAPTVEDVLREFAFQVGQSTTDDDIVAEYAAKLQLKEDA